MEATIQSILGDLVSGRTLRRAIAYHEAGHAVAAHALGRRIAYVTLGGAGVDGGCKTEGAGAKPTGGGALEEWLRRCAGALW